MNQLRFLIFQVRILLSTHDLDLAVRLADTLLQVADSGIQKVDCQQVEKEMSLLLDI